MGIVKESKRERMMRNVAVNPQTGCWEWTKSRRRRGYGYCSKPFYGQVSAHRAFYAEFVAQIPAGAEVCHRCDNPPCCNPEHLFIGTRKDNCLDASAKGRYHNQTKTHCKRGHPLSGDNVYFKWNNRDQKRQRACIACRNLRKRERRREKADALALGLLRDTGERRDGGRVLVAVP